MDAIEKYGGAWPKSMRQKGSFLSDSMALYCYGKNPLLVSMTLMRRPSYE
jgi:hypothetical protein